MFESPEATELERWIRYSLKHYLRCLGNVDIYEDCLQEARLSLWNARRKINTLSEDGKRAYMVTCIRHAAMRLLRQELSFSSRHLPLNDTVEEVSDEAQPAVNVLCFQGWVFSLDDTDLQRELMVLPERDREILYFYYTCQMTDSEVAQKLHCAASAIQQQRRRVLRRLRLRLQRAPATSPFSHRDTR